jgi:hypothetical protein
MTEDIEKIIKQHLAPYRGRFGKTISDRAILDMAVDISHVHGKTLEAEKQKAWEQGRDLGRTLHMSETMRQMNDHGAGV